MSRTIFKICCCFIASAVFISILLLLINFAGFGYMLSDVRNRYENSPRKLLDTVAKEVTAAEGGYDYAENISLPKDIWCILLNENGDVVWEENMPPDIPVHYRIQDIAKMTRWYLNDYPVYVQAEDIGLFVMGYPKNSVGKYDLEYSMEWFRDLPKRSIFILLFNICLATLLAFLIGFGLYRRLKALVKGIRDLRQETPVHLKEKGIFRDVVQNINETSNVLERKNAVLKQKDEARRHWIAGISHDIRTPLTIMTGYAEELAESRELREEDRKKADIIVKQGLRIKTLIADLNLSSSLEYDMQPARKRPVKIGAMLRSVVTALYNSGLAEVFDISLEVLDEKAEILGDGNLLERAVYNLLNNSIVHNPDGCAIHVKESVDVQHGEVIISITDDGSGVAQEILDKMDCIPNTVHGLGLPMAYRIVKVHGGKFEAENHGGFRVRIIFPLA